MNLIALVGSKFATASVIVLISVIVLLSATFVFLFYLYYKYYSKSIIRRLEDENIKKDLINDNKKFFNNVRELINSDFSFEEKQEKSSSFAEFLAIKQVQKKKSNLISSIVSWILSALIIALVVFSFVINIRGDMFYIGGSAKLVILSGSMETANPANTYLTENNITNRIKTYALITLSEINEDTEIKLYDIVAFKDDNNNTIVHRVISISTNSVTNEMRYTLRGDANNVSSSVERNLKRSDIVGIYTGEQDIVLGLFISYLKSSIGVITLILAYLSITCYEYFIGKINKLISERTVDISAEIDKEILKAFKDKASTHLFDVKQKIDHKVIFKR